jgi:hypothetical protein
MKTSRRLIDPIMDRNGIVMEMVSRTVVELCIEAERKLIDKHGYTPEDFIESDGAETAPPSLSRKLTELIFQRAGRQEKVSASANNAK